MRTLLLALLIAAMLVGCAHPAQNPASPDFGRSGAPGVTAAIQGALTPENGRYRLFGEWTWLFPATHDRVEVVPRRLGRFHLNAMKFLEGGCTNCLTITGFKNNGDSTFDLTVKMTHPFAGHPEYTGFDVKGIVMFNGSYELSIPSSGMPIPDPAIISWRETGDAEVLNPDGYAYRWSPGYDSGSPLPIFNYWEGKYATGTPNATINAYLNFYSVENRHMFLTADAVVRTYKIYLPPGQPIVAGYAVEACWEPPIKVPVTDPANDFPLSANQTEPYFFNVIINNGEPIDKDIDCCCDNYPDCCDDLRFWAPEWDEDKVHFVYWRWNPTMGGTSINVAMITCEPDYPDSFSMDIDSNLDACPPGTYRDLAFVYYKNKVDLVFDLVDYTIIE
jgi:hypothetical protein